MVCRLVGKLFITGWLARMSGLLTHDLTTPLIASYRTGRLAPCSKKGDFNS